MTSFVLAGGCFWCLDAVYRQVHGVTQVVSGYTGGELKNPTYREVCSGITGHAEAVAVEFDPQAIPENIILDMFFTMHDPTQLNRQGADIGTQYRSALFYQDEVQKERFAQAIDRAQQWWAKPIVTDLTSLEIFYRAEEYHQDFFAKNPDSGYCNLVAAPKVNKIRSSFAEFIKP